MSLTPAQQATLKAAIIADGALNAQPNTADGAFAIADALNLLASPTVTVWRTNAPVQDIFDAIDWTKYTPTDAPDNTATFTNRALAIQTKQMNLQNMLVGRDSVNANKLNVRAGLRDAVIQLPSGVAGAFVTSGGASGVTVLTACTRPALRIEAILSGVSATTGTVTAFLIGYEGTINYQDVYAARNS